MSKPTREHWRPDADATECAFPGCSASFSLFSRRSHCRKCGDIFCSKHCSKQLQLDANAQPCVSAGSFCKVCDACHAVGYPNASAFASRGPLRSDGGAAAGGWDAAAAHGGGYGGGYGGAYGGGYGGEYGGGYGGGYGGYGGVAAEAYGAGYGGGGGGSGGPPHFGLEVNATVPAAMVLESGVEADVAGTVESVAVAFEHLNLVAELVHQLPGAEAKGEVVAANREALDAMVPVLVQASALFSAVLDSDVLRATPPQYNYFVLAAKEVAHAQEYVGGLDALVAGGGSGAVSGTRSGAGGSGAGVSDSDSESDEGGLAVRGGAPPPFDAPSHVPVAVPVAVAAASAAMSSTEAVAAEVGRHEAEAEAVLTAVLAPDDAGCVDRARQEMRVLRLRVRTTKERVEAMDASEVAEDDKARFVQRLAAVLEYLDGYAATVLASGFEDVGAKVGRLEEAFYALFLKLDDVERADVDGVHAYEEEVKALTRELAAVRTRLEEVGDGEARRGVAAVENVMENMSELTFTASKKFAGVWGEAGSASTRMVDAVRVDRARVAHARVESDMFGL